MNPEQFNQLRQQLDRPTPQVLSWEAIQAKACPPNLSEDQEWPTPTDHTTVANLLSRLSEQARVLCVLTAAEMLQDKWREWASGRGAAHKADPESLSAAIDFAWQGVRQGKALSAASKRAMSVRMETERIAANFAFYDRSFDTETQGGRVRAAVGAIASLMRELTHPYIYNAEAGARYAHHGNKAAALVCHAAILAQASTQMQDEASHRAFFAEWWRKCRCRLAFAFVESSVVSGPSTYAQIQAQLTPRIKRLGNADVQEILHPHTTLDDPSDWFPPQAQAEQAQRNTSSHLWNALSALPESLRMKAVEIALKLAAEPLLTWLEHPEPYAYYWVSALAGIGEAEVYKAGFRKWPPDNPGDAFRAVILNLLADPAQPRSAHGWPGADKLASWDAIRREFSLLAEHLINRPLGQPLRRLAGAAAYAFANYAAVRSEPIASVTPQSLANIVDWASAAWEPDSHDGESTYDSRLSFLRTWANQVRSRFAFADVLEAEVSGPPPAGNTPTPPTDYQAIQQAVVAQPKRWAQTTLADLERRCKDVPEDPAWPPKVITGDLISEILRHLRPMSEGAQLLCALTALEMLIPAWEATANAIWPTLTDIPREASNRIWAWHQGLVNTGDIRTLGQHLDQSWHLAEGTLRERQAATAEERGAIWAIRAAWRITNAITSYDKFSVGCAYAIWTVGIGLGRAAGLDLDRRAEYTRTVYLPRWWRLCRCRLAFADAPTAEVSGLADDKRLFDSDRKRSISASAQLPP